MRLTEYEERKPTPHDFMLPVWFQTCGHCADFWSNSEGKEGCRLYPADVICGATPACHRLMVVCPEGGEA